MFKWFKYLEHYFGNSKRKVNLDKNVQNISK